MTKDEWRLRIKDADGGVRYVPVTWSGLEIPRHEHHEPPADVVEVVRCKDCSFWYVPKLEKGEKLGACGWWSGNAHIRATRAEDYCSRGIRKEGEE